jgi:ribosome-associated protein
MKRTMKKTKAISLPEEAKPEEAKVEGARERALRIAEAVQTKHAEEVVVLEVGALSALTDFFVICSASSEPQIQAIVGAVRAAFPTEKSSAMEGAAGNHWVLMDYTDVILHIFKTEARAFYSLDRLWGDAPQIPTQVLPPPTRSTPKRSRATADISG